jgi:hypothetical protein
MKKSKLGALSLALPVSLALSLAACGGSDTDNGGSGASGGGAKSTSGGSTSTNGGTPSGGSSSKAGSSGTGDKGGSTGSGTDVPGNTPLSDLTDDQFEQLCDDFSERFSGAQYDDTACKLNAVFSSIFAQSDEEAQQLCKTSYDNCKASPSDNTQSCEKPGSECTATVDEMNACLDEVSEIFGGLTQALPSCDTLKVSEVTSLLLQIGTSTPASCATYEEKCPDGPQAPGADDAMP